MRKMKKKLNIYCNQTIAVQEGYEVCSLEQLAALARSGKIVRQIGCFHSVSLHCDSLETLGQPFLIAAACRMLTTGKCYFQDDEHNRLTITLGQLIVLFIQFVKEQITAKSYINKIDRKVTALFSRRTGDVLAEGHAMFLRCDLPYYYMAGGSIGHIAGVVNNMEICTGEQPIIVSSRDIPTVNKGVERCAVDRTVQYRNAGDIMSIAYNKNIEEALDKVFRKRKISFIYQRSALNAFAGVEYAMSHHIPFVLEYNGSEIWIAKNWGNRNIKGINISEKIERLTFEKANLITCVSSPLKQQLIEIGIDKEKIIVTPNGVNTQMYRPDIDGMNVRKQYGIGRDKTVIGFIGTFGAWHGAEILTSAFAEIEKVCKKVHLLMIGDGVKMADVKKIIKHNHMWNQVTLTGIVPQHKGPEYLAACDILVSPTVKNPDGTPFFGSPTKLFEYMAMGKGIVASDLDQLSEILENEKTALLIEPNSVNAAANAIVRLVEDKELRERLGRNAREEVCKRYTWKMHTEKIVQELKIRCK